MTSDREKDPRDPRSEAEKARADLMRNDAMGMAVPESPLERQPSVTPQTFGDSTEKAQVRSGIDQGVEAGGAGPEVARRRPIAVHRRGRAGRHGPRRHRSGPARGRRRGRALAGEGIRTKSSGSEITHGFVEFLVVAQPRQAPRGPGPGRAQGQRREGPAHEAGGRHGHPHPASPDPERGHAREPSAPEADAERGREAGFTPQLKRSKVARSGTPRSVGIMPGLTA